MRARAAALVLPLLLVAGCSGGVGGSDESSADVAPAAGAAQDAGGTTGGRDSDDGGTVVDLESLQARLEALEARVDLSTVSVTFDSSGAPVIGDAPGFADGLSAGWSALSTAGRVLAVTVGAVLPFLPLLLVAGRLALRSRSRRAAPTG